MEFNCGLDDCQDPPASLWDDGLVTFLLGMMAGVAVGNVVALALIWYGR